MVKQDERFELVALAKSSSGSFHRIMWDKSRERHCCTCTGFVFHDDCKHMRAFKRKDKSMIVPPAEGMATLLGDKTLSDK